MRDFVVAGNWKMYKNPQQTKAFVDEFLGLLERDLQKKILLFPSTLCLQTCREALSGSYIQFGAQNCHFEAEGAFTGETSPRTLHEFGASYVLIGHSERRAIFGETDELLSKKVKSAQEFDLTPILCIGETLAEREAGETQTVIKRQLIKGLSLAHLEKPLILAYEPVWAIGTGKVATPAQAEEAHQFLRSVLHEIGGGKLSTHTVILYGGSVKPDNARELGLQPNIDGFLVGGASLKPTDFAAIAKVSKSN